MSNNTLPTSVAFDGATLNIIDRDGTPWLSAPDLARALGYSDAGIVARIYRKHAAEFTSAMSDKTETVLSGNLRSEVRVFSPRGCHLIAMFARTERAAAFRRWVLDVLEGLVAPRPAVPLVSAEFNDPAHRLRAWARATSANLKAVPVVPADLLDGIVANMLFSQRWLVRFDGRLEMTMQQVPDGAMVIEPKDRKSIEVLLREYLPRALLPEVIQTAVNRLVGAAPKEA